MFVRFQGSGRLIINYFIDHRVEKREKRGREGKRRKKGRKVC